MLFFGKRSGNDVSEAKGLEYSTVLVDNYGSRASWIGGQTPQVQWPDGRRQSESLDIIKALEPRLNLGLFKDLHYLHRVVVLKSRNRMKAPAEDVEFPDIPLWPKGVTELVNAFRSTFPKQTRLGAVKKCDRLGAISNWPRDKSFKKIEDSKRNHCRSSPFPFNKELNEVKKTLREAFVSRGLSLQLERPGVPLGV